MEITLHRSIAEIGPQDWDLCACPEAASGRAVDPFTTYRFLHALEESGSVGAGTGWGPHHLALREDGAIRAVMPLYVKSHSQGEYIFDFNWADAWQRAGGNYYPKLQSAVPFTPATGRRFLCREGFEDEGQAWLTAALVEIAQNNNLSSLHITFCTEAEAAAGPELGLMPRISQQFHWQDAGYDDFTGFLTALSSHKRKMIKRERRVAQAFGGTILCLTGDQIEPRHWDALWAFYQDTGSRKWGTPYLTRAFFDLLHDTMRDDILLIIAEREGQPVAGALNFIGRDTLYGRYWGALIDHPFLHFEVCYYQAIDWALQNRLTRVEAGAQGEHKLARGYLPVRTHSLHWIADAGFRRAVGDFLLAEAAAVGEDIEVLTQYGPFHRIHRDETD